MIVFRQKLKAKVPRATPEAASAKYEENDRRNTRIVLATASLADILGADRLVAARRYAATELRSGVFLSQPDGPYRFEPLPRIAQLAPLQGVATPGDTGSVDLLFSSRSLVESRTPPTTPKCPGQRARTAGATPSAVRDRIQTRGRLRLIPR